MNNGTALIPLFVFSFKIPATGSIFKETVKINTAEPILPADHPSLDLSSPQISPQRSRVHSQNARGLAECQELVTDWGRLNFRSLLSQHPIRPSRVFFTGPKPENN